MRPRLVALLLLVSTMLSGCMGDDSGDVPSQSTARATPDVAAETPAPRTPTNRPTELPADPTVATARVTPIRTATLAQTPTPTPGPDDLVGELLRGGHVIYIRHATTDWGQTDTDQENLTDCGTQRNLIDAGRAQARSIGIAFQQLAIPVGELYSSRYCRALETARLAFGDPRISDDLTGTPAASEADQRRRNEALLAILATPTLAGTNTVLVSHQFNLREATDVDLAEEGQAAIFRPDGMGGSLHVGTLLAEEWLALSTRVNGPRFQAYGVPDGSHPHDVAPAPDGTVWYTAQGSGKLGRLDPVSGDIREVSLGSGSAPHGVIVGPDGAPWVTDGGLNAIVRVDPASEEVRTFPLPPEWPNANLNTAAFANGILWFTGQAGIYGRLDPASGEMQVFDAPGDRGPYGMTATPDGTVYYASLAGSHIARIEPDTGAATVLQPPTTGQGARRVWSDSSGRVWVSEWNVGQVAVYDPERDSWREWRLPGEGPQAYAVYVDERDIVWLTDFPNNALVSFDPDTEQFESFPLPNSPANLRQLLGRTHEVWGAGSGTETLIVLRVP